MTSGQAIDPILLTVFGLLVVGVLVAGRADRLPVPSSLLFLGIGMLVADDALALVRFDDPVLVQDIAIVALVLILFEGGLTTKVGDLRAGGAAGLLLSNVGVLVTAGAVAVAVRAILDTEWITALLLGAIVSSTDAAAVFSLLKRAPVPRRLAAMLQVESGANDPFAVVLTLGLVAHATQGSTGREWAVFAALQLLGGVAGGLAGGAGTVALLRRAAFGSSALYPVLAFACAGLIYASTATLGGSGFLAVYLAGLLVNGGVPRHRRLIREFHGSLASAAEIALFLLLGVLVFPSRLPAVAAPALAVTAVLVLIARPLAVAVCLTPFRIPMREQAVVAWAGLRGAVPIVLATFPFTAGLEGGDTIFDVVFFVVLASVLLQGSTVTMLARRLGLATQGPAWRAITEVLPVEAPGVELVELTVTPDLAVAGAALGERPPPPGFLATSIIRGHEVILPTGTTQLLEGDVVVFAGPPGRDAAQTLLHWATAEVENDPAEVGDAGLDSLTRRRVRPDDA